MVSSLWNAYHSDEGYLAFQIPFIFWIGTYLYCRFVRKMEFHRWYTIHNFHNGMAILMGMISIYNDDDSIFNERVCILFSLSYFIVDLWDCALRLDVTYGFHAVMCLSLGLVNYNTPECRLLRTNSKASLCECSNPFMHLAKSTRKPTHFVLFVLVYTCCRILWIPVIMWQLHEKGVLWPWDPRQLALLAFYGLNCFWYFKMLRILVGFKPEQENKTEDNKKDS